MNRAVKKIRRGLLLVAVLLLVIWFGHLMTGKRETAGWIRQDAQKSFGDSGQTDSVRSQADEDFETFLADLFREEVSGSALSLHYILEDPEAWDIMEYNTQLGTYSEENSHTAGAFAENVLHALDAYDADALNVKNQMTMDVLKDALESTCTAVAFSWYEEPLRVSTGEQAELPVLLAEYTFRDRQDIEDYLEILDSIPDYFSGICEYEREKAEQGLFMQDFAADTIIAQCREFASAEDHYLLYTFEEKVKAVKGLSRNEVMAYEKQNAAIVTQRVLPAYIQIADTLEEIRGTEHAVNFGEENVEGLCGLPDGSAYYEYLVRKYTGSSDSVAQLQKRTEAQRMSDLTRASDLLTEHPGLEEEMMTASAPVDSPEETLALLQEAIREDFPQVEDCQYQIKYIDEAMEDYMAPAFYLTAPIDHYTENTIYINQKNGYDGLRLFTTLAHEGFPGHLYQNAVFSETGPSPIRILLGTPGYTEGWATYIELLSYKYAGIPEVAAEALALEQSAILSLYATADMGIHHDGWTFADTYRFFADYGFSDEQSVRDIYELIIEEPAHYLKYYIGYLEFLSLQQIAKEQYAEDYTDMRFHQYVLEMGPAPFWVLKKYIRWE